MTIFILTPEQIKLAGRMIKVLNLANSPGMDEVAIKLNSGLTWEEQREAEMWAKAFEIAQQADGNLFERAVQLRGAMR